MKKISNPFLQESSLFLHDSDNIPRVRGEDRSDSAFSDTRPLIRLTCYLTGQHLEQDTLKECGATNQGSSRKSSMMKNWCSNFCCSGYAKAGAAAIEGGGAIVKSAANAAGKLPKAPKCTRIIQHRTRKQCKTKPRLCNVKSCMPKKKNFLNFDGWDWCMIFLW